MSAVSLNILYLASLLMDMSVAAWLFAITRRAAELHASSLELGLLGGTVTFAVYTAISLVTGKLSDRIGRRVVAATGVGVASLASLACAFITSVPVLVVLCGFCGAGFASFWPAIIGWLSDGATGPELSRRLTRFSVAWNLGLFLGFGTSGVVFTFGPRAAFYLAAGTLALIVALLFIAKSAPATAPVVLPASVPVPKGRGFRKTAWIANFTVNFTAGGVMAVLPGLMTHLNIASDVHGGLVAMSRGAALAMFLSMQTMVFWRTRVWPLWVAQIIGAAGAAALAWSTAPWHFALALIAIGAVSGMSYQASLYFTMDEVSAKGEGGGLHEAFTGAGMFLGPLFAGWIGQSGRLLPYPMCAAFILLMVAVQAFVVSWQRKWQSMTPPQG
jgi:MFS family permease